MQNFKFFQFFFGGGDSAQLGCALTSLGQSLTRVKKIEGAAAPKGGNVVSCKMSTWVGHYAPLELFCLWTKVHQISFPNVEGVAVEQVFFSDVRYVDPF